MSNELTIVKTIPGSRKQVFQAWLDPKALKQFMCPGPGMTVPKVEVDARVGGNFLIVMKAGDTELPHQGTYKTIDEYDRLAFTWVSAPAGKDSEVILDFEELGAKETRLTLRHTGLPSVESRNNHEGGWKVIIDLCAEVVTGR